MDLLNECKLSAVEEIFRASVLLFVTSDKEGVSLKVDSSLEASRLIGEELKTNFTCGSLKHTPIGRDLPPRVRTPRLKLPPRVLTAHLFCMDD